MKNDNPWIIKFGKKEHLEQILNGKFRFCSLSYYRNYEEEKSEKGTKDIREGASEIIYPKTTTSKLEVFGLPNDIFEAESLVCIPKQEKYIACFSYFTEEDITNKQIISSMVLKNTNWDSVLLFKNPNDLIAKLSDAVGIMFSYSRIHYYDDEKQDINELNEFFKPKRFEYQKEFRLSFPMPEKFTDCIEKTDAETCFIHLKKIDGYICKTSEFQEKIEKSFFKNEIRK